MTASAVMALAAVPATESEPDVPEPFRQNFSFEYKLGWAAGPEAWATCPILNKHLFADSRKAAWKAGYRAYRESHGLKVRHLRPMSFGSGAK